MLRREPNVATSTLLWMPDSRHLLVVERSFVEGIAGAGTVFINIVNVDVETIETKPVCSFKYEVKPGMELTSDDSLFNPLKVSKDGKYLFFSLLQFEEPPYNGLFLKAINVQDGSITTMCRIGSVRGLDWHDESQPLPALSTSSTPTPAQQKQPQPKPVQKPRSSAKPSPRKTQSPASAKTPAR